MFNKITTPINEQESSNHINTMELINELFTEFPLSEKDPLKFLQQLNLPFLTIKTFKTLPVEIRAIVPNNVESFIEYTPSNHFTIYHSDLLSDTLTLTQEECLWYSIIFMLIKIKKPQLIEFMAPYTSSQSFSMFPFKSIQNQLSDDNLTHNKLIFYKLGIYEKVCHFSYQFLKQKQNNAI